MGTVASRSPDAGGEVVKRERKPKPFKTEAELCAAFIKCALEQGWTAYPETCDFDIVLVRDGVQVGIQAKMAFNATLLRQILPSPHADRVGSPAHLGILLPTYDRDVNDVCRLLGIAYFKPAQQWRSDHDNHTFVPDIEHGITWDHAGYRPIDLPEYVPDVIAGAPAPVVLSEWKIKALRLCAILAIRGYVVSEDFKWVGLDRRRWMVPYNGWLKAVHLKPGRWVAGEKLHFPEQHPEVFPKIVEEMRATLAEREAAQ